jgi:hypothetical protein
MVIMSFSDSKKDSSEENITKGKPSLPKVTAQITYATLMLCSDGIYVTKVLKQKIMVRKANLLILII